MAHRELHWVGKRLVSSNREVTLVGPAVTLLFLAVVLSSGFVSVSNAALPPTCVGDCDNSDTVTVDELLNGVNIALGTQPLDQCRQFDCNGIGQVTVDCIIGAVSAALNGCQSAPTSSPTQDIGTATPSLTSTPTPPSDHFVDNGDGTITDTQTDLIWEKKDQGGGLHDTNSRYPWAGICSDNGEFCQPDAAAATTCNAATGGPMGCAQCGGTAICHPIIGSTTVWDWLNQINAANFAGHSDWRIPTVGRDGGTVQLETIVDQSVSGCGSVPCVPPAFNTGCVAACTATGCSCTQAERYWSATSIVGNLPFPSVWGVFFRTGDVTAIDKASAFFVRAVRGGAPIASQTATRAPTQPATSTPTAPTATNTPTTTPTTATAPCGTFLGKFGSHGRGDGQFFFPEAVAVDQSGNIFVADTGNHRVEKFTSAGTFVLQWGSMGSANGQFDSPEGVAVDAAGNVFVTDLNNNRIEKFDNNGTFLTTWGDAGNGDGQFSGPVGVAADATGNVFVADRFNNRVQKFTNTGSFLTKWGTVGTGDGQFGNPVGIAVDRNHNVFVSDFFNDRIQKFTDTGTFLTKWGSRGSGNGQFINARNVAVGEGGNVFTVDDGNDRIEVFSDTGIFVTAWGSLGNADGQFNSATAVAVAANGEILVTDESDRVQRFACSPTIDEAALVASARVATDSIFRFFDLQASLGTAASVAARSRAATGSAGVSGCQQLDCALFGTREDCCSGTQFSEFFSNCTFDDDLGRVVSLNGLFVLDSDTADVCTGAIPVGASFAASLSNFTQDVTFPDHSFSRTFQELSETFEVTPGGCTVSQPDPFGFGIRGDGQQFIDGELQQFQGDGLGNILVDIASKVRGLEIAVGSTQEPDACTVGATLNGSLTSGDFRVGRQFTTDFIDFHVVQLPQAGALFLGLNGTVGTDCLGDVTLSTIEPLRIASADTCFTAGRLEAQLEDRTVSVTYTESAGLDLDFGADGSVNQHFATCTDVPADQCNTSLVGLCGACTALNQCQTGLGCLPCSRDCSGNTSRCTLPDTFATCEDGVF